jgi:hypothetical protein
MSEVEKPRSKRALVDNMSMILNKIIIIVISIVAFFLLIIFLLNTFGLNSVAYTTNTNAKYVMTNDTIFKDIDSDVVFKINSNTFVGCIVFENTEDILSLVENQNFTSLDKFGNNYSLDKADHKKPENSVKNISPDEIICNSDMIKLSSADSFSPTISIHYTDIKNSSFGIYNPNLEDINISIESDFDIDNGVYSLVIIIGTFTVLILLLLKLLFKPRKKEKISEPLIERFKHTIRNFNKHEINKNMITDDTETTTVTRGKRRK